MTIGEYGVEETKNPNQTKINKQKTKNKTHTQKHKTNQPKKQNLWVCYLWSVLDFILMLLYLALWCVGPGSPGQFSGPGQCDFLSVPVPGQPG